MKYAKLLGIFGSLIRYFKDSVDFLLLFSPKFLQLFREKEIPVSVFCYHCGQNHPRQGVFLKAELKLAKKLIILSSL